VDIYICLSVIMCLGEFCGLGMTQQTINDLSNLIFWFFLVCGGEGEGKILNVEWQWWVCVVFFVFFFLKDTPWEHLFFAAYSFYLIVNREFEIGSRNSSWRHSIPDIMESFKADIILLIKPSIMLWPKNPCSFFPIFDVWM
jgi:hypothetical protein